MAKKRPHRAEVGIRVAENGHILVRIDELGYLKGTKQRRPLFGCPACGEKVRPRIGSDRRPHFAHASRADCWALTEEGRLHLEAKHHLASELRKLDAHGRAALGLPVRCGEDGARLRDAPELFGCAESDRHAFGDWLGVTVEKRDSLTTRRPDIKLVGAQGDTVLAIEIVHHNAVDEAKAAELFTAGVPWVEVDVSGGEFARVMAWTSADSAFPASRASVDFAWRCHTHGVSEAPLFFRFVDSYFPMGEPWEDIGFRRDVYWVVRRWEQAREVSNSLFRSRQGRPPEHLGDAAEGVTTIGALLHRAQQVDIDREPVSTDRDRTPWMNVEHLPAQERLPYILRCIDDYATFPKRRDWSFSKKEHAWKPGLLPMSPAEIKVAALALLHRLRGHEKAWPESPRNPFDVPVIPSGLRAAWLADDLWEMLEGVMSGERVIPGVEPFTKEELWARLRAPPSGGDRPQ